MRMVLIIVGLLMFFSAALIEYYVEKRSVNKDVIELRKTVDSLTIVNMENKKLLECYQYVVNSDTSNPKILAKIMRCYSENKQQGNAE